MTRLALLADDAGPIADPSRMTGQTIQLQNPVAHHFGAFVVGNAFAWQTRAMYALGDIMEAVEHAELLAEFKALKPGLAYSNPRFHDAIERYFPTEFVVQEGAAAGQHLVLCGAGPSLREHIEEWAPKADQLWGCNSAATWLATKGYPVTHGFTVDQTAHMVTEWRQAPDIEYLLASTVHPHLVDSLEKQGRGYRFFHNYVGIKGPECTWADANGIMQSMEFEDWMYAVAYPRTVRCGAGLNSVTRAIELGSFMGFAKITVLGADCALRVRTRPPMPSNPFGKTPARRKKEHDRYAAAFNHWLVSETIMHADGGNALASEATPVVIHTAIDPGTPDDAIRTETGIVRADSPEWNTEFWRGLPKHTLQRGHGRLWATKPDMVMSAQWLVRMQRAFPDLIELVGDTLPNALKDKDEAYLLRLPNFVDAQGRIANIPLYDVPTVPQEVAGAAV